MTRQQKNGTIKITQYDFLSMMAEFAVLMMGGIFPKTPEEALQRVIKKHKFNLDEVLFAGLLEKMIAEKEKAFVSALNFHCNNVKPSGELR